MPSLKEAMTNGGEMPPSGDGWPDDATARGELLRACPEEIRKPVMGERAKLRGHPGKVLGREQEIEDISRSLESVTSGPKTPEGLKAQAIIGPPGAGKSTMLEEIKRRLQAKGISVIELVAADVTKPEKFSEQVRQHPPWNRKDLWERVQKAVTSGAASAADDLITTFTTFGLKHLTKIAGILKGIEPEDVGPVQEALRAWREGQTPTMDKVLRLLQNSSKNGVVIIIDEGQELASYEKETAAGDNAAEVLRQINDPSIRAKARVWNVTMLIAGMQDTPDVVKRLTTVRPDKHILGPVPESAAREMIAHGIDRSQASETDKERAKAQWVGPLAARYSDWTRHARCAAEAARIVLDHAGGVALDAPCGTALLLAKAADERRTLYEEIITKGRLNGVSDGLQTVVMDALKANEERITPEYMARLVGTYIVENFGRPAAGLLDPLVEAKVAKHILEMARSGQISLRDGQYLSPIPSLVRHMTTERKAERAVTYPIIEAAGLKTGDPDRNPPDD